MKRKIKWVVDTYATISIDGKPTQLLEGGEYLIPDDEEYFKNAIERGWAVILEESTRVKVPTTKMLIKEE